MFAPFMLTKDITASGDRTVDIGPSVSHETETDAKASVFA